MSNILIKITKNIWIYVGIWAWFNMYCNAQFKNIFLIEVYNISLQHNIIIHNEKFLQIFKIPSII